MIRVLLMKILNGYLYVLVSVLIAAIILESVGAVFYYQENSLTKPPIFGGPPLKTHSYSSSFDFDPITLYSNSESPINEALYAKRNIEIPNLSNRKYTIFLLGASTLANIRMPPGERISDYLERALVAGGQDARVFNFGVPSYISWSELQLIVGKLVYLKPDMVIVYNGHSDAFYGSTMRKEIWRPNFFNISMHYSKRFDQTVRQIMTPLQRLNFFLDGVSYTKYLLQKIVNADEIAKIQDMNMLTARQNAEQLAANREQQCSASLPLLRTPNETFKNVATVNRKAIDVYINNIAAMATALSDRSIRFVQVIPPTAFSKKRLFPCEKRSIELNNFMYQGFADVFQETLAIMGRELKKLSTTQNDTQSMYIDLSLFTDEMDEYIFDDFAHAYRKGPLTRLVGEEIARHLFPTFRLN